MTLLQSEISPGSRFGHIQERNEHGLLILTHSRIPPERRVLFVNSYGGRDAWLRVKLGQLPPHHFWGCLELLEHGYEVGVAEPVGHFTYRCALPHDWQIFRSARAWLKPDDILYCGHTLLYWVPLLCAMGQLKCQLVSLTYARESLDFSGVHRGIVALTPAAAEQASKMTHSAKVAHLGWGVDLSFFPSLPFKGEWLLSCGRTHRDHLCLHTAAKLSQAPVRLIAPSLPPELHWPPNVTLKIGGNADDTVSYRELLNDYYARSAGSLIVLQSDPNERHAVGFTNLIEAMAMARPVIVTRTGALAGEIDVEAAGCGLHVPAGEGGALAAAIDRLLQDPAAAAAMGEQGRRLCESHYNINRFGADLHRFFQSL